MDLSTFHETTVTDCDTQLAVRVIFIPQASLAPHVRDALFDWGTLLGFTTLATLQGFEEITTVLASMISSDNGDALALAKTITEDPHLPFGAPVTASSLRQMIERAAGSDAPLPTTVLTAAGTHRFLLLADERGIVLVGTAASMAASLEEGLEEKLREIMGLDGREAHPLASG